MTNLEIIRKVNEGFAEGNTEKIRQYVSEDVQRNVIGVSCSNRKKIFGKEISNDFFVDRLTIKIKNEIEKGDWIAVEGEVQCKIPGGDMLDAFFFDVYHLENGKIKEIRSYVIEKK
jgi:ketosteroid isomerase-like protein